MAAIVISIHALLAESDAILPGAILPSQGISIHALLAESDFTGAGWLQIIYNFYPRSPCGERLSKFNLGGEDIEVFLSTLSLRRATETLVILPKELNNFYPRSPCGERQLTALSTSALAFISIHALLAESDLG